MVLLANELACFGYWCFLLTLLPRKKAELGTEEPSEASTPNIIVVEDYDRTEILKIIEKYITQDQIEYRE